MTSKERYPITLPRNITFNFIYYKDLPKCPPPRPPTDDCPSKLQTYIPQHPDLSLKYVILQTFREEVDGCSRQLWIDGPGRTHTCCNNSNDSSKLLYYSCVTEYVDTPMYDCLKLGRMIFYTMVAETNLNDCANERAALKAEYKLLEGVRWGLEKTSSNSCKSLCLRKMTGQEIQENKKVFEKTYSTARFKI